MRCAALALLMLCLLAPTADADGFDTLQGLAKRHLRPAPLVFTTAPAPLSDLGATLALVPGNIPRCRPRCATPTETASHGEPRESADGGPSCSRGEIEGWRSHGARTGACTRSPPGRSARCR